MLHLIELRLFATALLVNTARSIHVATLDELSPNGSVPENPEQSMFDQIKAGITLNGLAVDNYASDGQSKKKPELVEANNGESKKKVDVVALKGSSCVTVNGAACIFPFVYSGTTHYACTDQSPTPGTVTPAWCAVEVDENTTMVTGKFGECDKAACGGGGTAAASVAEPGDGGSSDGRPEWKAPIIDLTSTESRSGSKESRSGSSGGGTILIADAAANDTTIEVADATIFSIGDKITIGKSPVGVEMNAVMGFGSILLDKPLRLAHPKGTPVEHAVGAAQADSDRSRGHGEVPCLSDALEKEAKDASDKSKKAADRLKKASQEACKLKVEAADAAEADAQAASDKVAAYEKLKRKMSAKLDDAKMNQLDREDVAEDLRKDASDCQESTRGPCTRPRRKWVKRKKRSGVSKGQTSDILDAVKQSPEEPVHESMDRNR
jgi:hypothetical protein